jgi:hypothetical protein
MAQSKISGLQQSSHPVRQFHNALFHHLRPFVARSTATTASDPVADINDPPHGNQMEILSALIVRAIEIAGLEGNGVASLSDEFSAARQVVFMRQPLSLSAKASIARELPQLRHYRSDRTPHNPADEGFADDDCNVLVSFPIAGEAFR